MSQQPTTEEQIITAQRLGKPPSPALVSLTLSPQWAELVRLLQTARNDNHAAAIVDLRTLEVGCVLQFDPTRR